MGHASVRWRAAPPTSARSKAVLPTDLEGMISDFVTDAITLSNGPELRETVAALRRAIQRYGDQRAAEERERIARLCDELARIFVAEDAPHSAAVAVLCGDTIRSAPTPAADRG